MSRVCKLSGKRPRAGNNVSFSQKKTRRWQIPNIQKTSVFVPELGKTVQLRVSTKAIKTIDKIGLTAYLNKRGLTLNDIL